MSRDFTDSKRTEQSWHCGPSGYRACRNSGLRVKDWCRENGVNEQTYYKWQKKLFTMAQTQQESRFAEVTPVRTSGNIAVTVRISGTEADIHSGADAATVETVLRV